MAGMLGLPAKARGSFGQNKLRTRDFQWQIFETEHFEIFYYPEEEPLARRYASTPRLRLSTTAVYYTIILWIKPPCLFTAIRSIFSRPTFHLRSSASTPGDFTEAFKNRIALPAPASPRQLRQVIQHEFMHALQFDILYGEGIRSFRVYKGYLMPLWLIEGMAEYAARIGTPRPIW